jgi:hypothetical protein
VRFKIKGEARGAKSAHQRPGNWIKNAPLNSELELELIQTRMIQKPLLWVEVGKSACVLVGICELRLSLPARFFDMTRNAPHFWTFSLGAWSASYGLSVFDRTCTGC